MNISKKLLSITLCSLLMQNFEIKAMDATKLFQHDDPIITTSGRGGLATVKDYLKQKRERDTESESFEEGEITNEKKYWEDKFKINVYYNYKHIGNQSYKENFSPDQKYDRTRDHYYNKLTLRRPAGPKQAGPFYIAAVLNDPYLPKSGCGWENKESVMEDTIFSELKNSLQDVLQKANENGQEYLGFYTKLNTTNHELTIDVYFGEKKRWKNIFEINVFQNQIRTNEKDYKFMQNPRKRNKEDYYSESFTIDMEPGSKQVSPYYIGVILQDKTATSPDKWWRSPEEIQKDEVFSRVRQALEKIVREANKNGQEYFGFQTGVDSKRHVRKINVYFGEKKQDLSRINEKATDTKGNFTGKRPGLDKKRDWQDGFIINVFHNYIRNNDSNHKNEFEPNGQTYCEKRDHYVKDFTISRPAGSKKQITPYYIRVTLNDPKAPEGDWTWGNKSAVRKDTVFSEVKTEIESILNDARGKYQKYLDSKIAVDKNHHITTIDVYFGEKNQDLRLNIKEETEKGEKITNEIKLGTFNAKIIQDFKNNLQRIFDENNVTAKVLLDKITKSTLKSSLTSSFSKAIGKYGAKNCTYHEGFETDNAAEINLTFKVPYFSFKTNHPIWAVGGSDLGLQTHKRFKDDAYGFPKVRDGQTLQEALDEKYKFTRNGKTFQLNRIFEDLKDFESDFSDVERGGECKELTQEDAVLLSVVCTKTHDKKGDDVAADKAKPKDCLGLFNNSRARLNGSRFLDIPLEELITQTRKFRHWVFYIFGNYFYDVDNKGQKNCAWAYNDYGVGLKTPFECSQIVPTHSGAWDAKGDERKIESRVLRYDMGLNYKLDYTTIDVEFNKIEYGKQLKALEIMRRFFGLTCSFSEVEQEENTLGVTCLSCKTNEFKDLEAEVARVGFTNYEKKLLSDICTILMVSEPLRLLDRGKASAGIINCLCGL